jgi:hypothetical protein
MTCKTHPDAPHGFVRGASHSEDRYVCECEFWEEPKMNERILEIKESTRPEIDWEARHYVELNNGEKEKWMDEWFEKFAELIVRECAGLCSDPVVVLQHWGLDADAE